MSRRWLAVLRTQPRRSPGSLSTGTAGLGGEAGLDPAAVWRECAFALGTRPDRLRLQLDLFYDRRNQIAHEGDWDIVQLDFRQMDKVHLFDCVRYAAQLAEAMDAVL